MDNISDILSSLSEDDINNLKQAAASIFSNNDSAQQSNSSNNQEILGGQIPSGFDPALIGKIGTLLSSIKNDDKRCILIGALRPYLSEERQKRCDEAIKILKLISMLPLLREQNIF